MFRQIGKDLYMIAEFGRIQTWELGDALLLGDEGYGIAPLLMTPYKEPLNAPQEWSYNNCLKIERLITERCFGQLTRRFPTLQGRVRIHLEFVPSVIVACCIMHNVPKYLQDPDDFPDYADLLGIIGSLYFTSKCLFWTLCIL